MTHKHVNLSVLQISQKMLRLCPIFHEEYRLLCWHSLHVSVHSVALLFRSCNIAISTFCDCPL